MGDRVAVIRKGVLQQVDTPQFLYDHPRNLFVAGFIGSPAMNMVEATVTASDSSLAVSFGGNELVLPAHVLAERPALRTFQGGTVILGIRPEDMEDAALVPDKAPEHRIHSEVLLREALGADVLVHFMIEAPAVLTEDVKEIAHDVGTEALREVELGVKRGRSKWVARLSPRTEAQKGQPIELVVDVARLHFFDVQTGLGIYGGDEA